MNTLSTLRQKQRRKAHAMPTDYYITVNTSHTTPKWDLHLTRATTHRGVTMTSRLFRLLETETVEALAIAQELNRMTKAKAQGVARKTGGDKKSRVARVRRCG